MADISGQKKDSGGKRTLFIKLSIAELLGTFDRMCVFKGKVHERNITGGKSATLSVSSRAVASYHDPVKTIVSIIKSGGRNERLINLDAPLIAVQQTTYSVNEMMDYYDARQAITHELGRALALEFDARAARVLYAAANRTAQTKMLSADYSSATKTAKGEELINLVSDLKVLMQKKSTLPNGLILVVGPEEYDVLLDSTRVTHPDSFTSGLGMQIKGINVFMSNCVTQPPYTKASGDNNDDYEQDLSKCVAILFHSNAIGVLSLNNPTLQVTTKENDYNIQNQSTLMVARIEIGMAVLRPEYASVIVVS